MRKLGIGSPLRVQRTYPRLNSVDLRVWTEYAKAPQIPFEQVWYDVPVGYGQYTGDDELSKRIDVGVWSKRIDVVGLHNGVYHVIEVKGFAQGYSLGQVLMYWDHFWRQYTEGKRSRPMIVAGKVDDDFVETCISRGVSIIDLGMTL